jgi:glycerate kinase
LGDFIHVRHGPAKPGKAHLAGQRFEFSADILVGNRAGSFVERQQVAQQLVERLQIEVQLVVGFQVERNRQAGAAGGPTACLPARLAQQYVQGASALANPTIEMPSMICGATGALTSAPRLAVLTVWWPVN